MTIPITTAASDEQEDAANSNWKIKVIPRVDLGHILTLIGMVSVLVVAYNSFDKRVVILEEAIKTNQIRRVERDAQWKDAILDLKIDVKELQRSVNEVNRNIRPVNIDRK